MIPLYLERHIALELCEYIFWHFEQLAGYIEIDGVQILFSLL